jgi:hypothetical protein
MSTALIAVLAAFLQSQEVKFECRVDVGPIWSDAQSLAGRLNDDVFVDVLDFYVKELETLIGEHDRWMSRAAAAKASCTEQTVASINAELAEIERRLVPVMERARSVLSQHSTEALFRKFAGQTRGATDCETMAMLLGALGRRVDGDVAVLADAAGKVLSDGVSLRVRGFGQLDLVTKSPNGYLRFNQSGFKQPYIDPDPNSANQVRHFVGYFVAGLIGARRGVTSTQLVAHLADFRDANQPADYSLGLVAGSLGFRVADTPSLTRSLEGAVRGAACR